MPRLWLANAEEALPEEDLHYEEFFQAKTLRMVPRFLLGLEAGDLLVVPTTLPEDFTRYVAELLGLGAAEDLVFEVEPRATPSSLVDSLLLDPGALAALKARHLETLEPFLQTPRAVRLARELALPCLGTEGRLVESGLVRDLNDKGWFKAFAREHGVPVLPGEEVSSRGELVRALEQAPGGELMLRKTSYAGGAGCTHGSARQLLGRLDGWYNAGRVLVEPFLDLASVAGSLALLDERGVHYVGIDRQVLRDGSWCGFDFPYPPGRGAGAVRDLTLDLAFRIHGLGARGVLNLDWAFPAGSPEEPLVLECNFRHNGFGYVADLAARLFGAGWERLVVHSREDLQTSARSASELIGRLRRLRLEGEPLLLERPGARQGAVLTLPPSGGTFSAAVFSEDPDSAREALRLVEEAA